MELGRRDLAMEVPAMSSAIDLPRESQLAAVLHMFLFLKSKHNGVTVFDPTEPEIYPIQFATEHWSATPYDPCKEDVPSNDPAPRDIGFTMRAFVDSDHAAKSVAGRSRNRFVVFLKN